MMVDNKKQKIQVSACVTHQMFIVYNSLTVLRDF